jgi:peptide/nickel transport system permease protein
MVVVLFGVSIVAFVLMHELPGDYAQVLGGGDVSLSPQALARLRHEAGLDQPLLVQYWHWARGAVHGDLGRSLVTHDAVSPELLSRLGVTAELATVASLMALLAGATTGLLSARLRGKVEGIVRGVNGLSFAVPSFVVATMIVLLGGLYAHSLWLFDYQSLLADPAANLKSLVLPACSLAFAMSAVISENTRAAVLEVANQDYVLVARAKGLTPSVVLRRYLLRSALTPVITVAGLQFAGLLGGTIVIEAIFNIPGIGQYLYQSVTLRDYPVIQGVVLIVAVCVILVNLVVDIAYARADARVVYE